MASKVFSSDYENENLPDLLDLDIAKLFDKYEQQKTNAENQYKIKLDEVTATLGNVKNKYEIQFKEREKYEKQQSKIMAILNITGDDKGFDSILQAIKELKTSHEQNETELSSGAQSVLDPQSSEDDVEIKIDPMFYP